MKTHQLGAPGRLSRGANLQPMPRLRPVRDTKLASDAHRLCGVSGDLTF
jgi:hypothetical protein